MVSESRVQPWAWAAMIFVLALHPFLGALENRFVNWDDDEYVYRNPTVQSLNGENLKKMAFGFHSNNWHPLTFLSHALDFKLFGFEPKGHHFFNLLIHAANVCLFFFLFVALVRLASGSGIRGTGLYLGGALAALAFGAHPLRVESVAWVAQRKDVLCAFFFLSALLVYLRYALTESQRNRRLLYWFCLVLSLFAMMSKPMAVTLPLVLILLDVYPLNRLGNPERRLNLLWEKLPFFAMSLLTGILTLLAQESGGALRPFGELGFSERIVNAFESVTFYLGKTVWPFGLSPFYPLPEDLTLARGSFVFALAVFAAITFFCAVMWRRGRKFWMIVWIYYLVTLSPALGIVQVGKQAAADRYSYLPTLGFFVLAGAGFLRIWNKDPGVSLESRGKLGYLAAALLVLLFLGDLSANQVRVWRNGETLWKRIIADSPVGLPKAHLNLGNYYRSENRMDEAQAEYETAVELAPDAAQGYDNLAMILSQKGELDEAEKVLKKALQIQPDFINAVNNLGVLYLIQKRYAEAERQFEDVLKLAPDNPAPHLNLGIIYSKTGRLGLAETAFRKVLEKVPGHPSAIANLEKIQRNKAPL